MASPYNLRSGARGLDTAVEGPFEESTTMPGELVTSAEVANGSSVGRTEEASVSSLLSSLSPRAGSPSAVRPGVSYSQAVTCASPQPSADDAVLRDESHGNSDVFTTSTPVPGNTNVFKATIEDVSDTSDPVQVKVEPVDDGGPWTTVHHGKRARSLEHARTDSATASKSARAGSAEPDIKAGGELVASAAKNVVENGVNNHQRETRKVETAAHREDNERPDSRGEGPSDPMRKGKMIDATNWGAAGIDPVELDPVMQRQIFESYASKAPSAAEAAAAVPDDVDPQEKVDVNEQRIALEYWRKLKEAERQLAAIQHGEDAHRESVAEPRDEKADDRHEATAPVARSDAASVHFEGPELRQPRPQKPEPSVPNMADIEHFLAEMLEQWFPGLASGRVGPDAEGATALPAEITNSKKSSSRKRASRGAAKVSPGELGAEVNPRKKSFA